MHHLIKIAAIIACLGLCLWKCTPEQVNQEQTTPDSASGQDTIRQDSPDNATGDTTSPDKSVTPEPSQETAPTDNGQPEPSQETAPETTPEPTPRDVPTTPDATPETTPEPQPEPSPDNPTTSVCGIKTFEDGKQPSRRLYVATTGNDSSGDGSASKPFATLQQAVKTATPGTAIVIRSGSYAGQSFSGLQGTAQAPIWIGGEPGQPLPVFENSGEGLHITKGRYLIIHHIEIRNTRNNGINCDDGGDYSDATATTHIIFRDLNIHDIGGSGNQDCLKLSGLRNYFVLDNKFAKCGGGGSGSGVDHVGCHDGVIARNEFTDMAGNAVQNKGGSTKIEIRQNLMVNAGARAINMGGSTGFTFFRPPLDKTKPNAEARNIRAVSNVIIGGETPFAFVGCVQCAAIHNTIVNPTRWLMRILQETNSRDGYTFEQSQTGLLINNIFYFDRSKISTYVNIGPNTMAPTFQFRNNLWYAHNNAGQSKPTLPSTEQGGIYGQDPLFAALSSQDLSLKPGSPAIGKGTPLNQPLGDRVGRCFQVPPSIGAYESAP